MWHVGFDYVAVPWPEGAPDPQPEMRGDLEARGFALLGGCALTADGIDEVSRTAPSYGDRADEFAEWAVQPGQVFAAPDGTAFTQLAWLWGCRYAAFTTVDAHGGMIQTLTAWGADPAWPSTLAPFYRWTDRHSEQLVLATDKDAQVVEGLGPAWASHQSRVAATGSVRRHTELEDFVTLYRAQSAARSSWSTRIQLASAVIAFVVVASALMLVFALVGPQPWWIGSTLGVVAAVAAIPVFVRIWMRSRRWRWLRRRFRAPAPGA